MLKLFPLRRSFSLDLAPDDSNSNFLLHASDDHSDLHVGGAHSSHLGAHLFSSHGPGASKPSPASSTVLYPNMTTAAHWPVDDIDDALAADFDGSLSGLGIELGTSNFNMSDALMALPSLSSLKHQAGEQSSNHGLHGHHHPLSSSHHPQQSHHPLSSGHLLNPSMLLSASSLQANLRGQHSADLPTSLERNSDSPQLNGASAGANEEKPVAVVHGKKNRLIFGADDDANHASAIKRFCLQPGGPERDVGGAGSGGSNGDLPSSSSSSSVHPTILLGSTGSSVSSSHHQEQEADEGNGQGHHCSDDCYADGHGCTLRHSSSVPDLRSHVFTSMAAAAVASTSNPPVVTSHGSSASSPSSSSTSAATPSTTSFFSQIISSQINNLSSVNCHVGSPSLSHELSHTSSSRHTSKFQYVLGASTSMAIKMHEETMTYLNQGQSYEIKLKKVGDLSEVKGKMLKTILRVCFHDRRLQYMERELIDQWKEQRPSERVLEIDTPLSFGVYDVRNDPRQINKSEFYWDPTKETGVFIKINCISTEFTPKKHGGEKGVPFRIVIETYCKESTDVNSCLHTASCQVKVFKPKGADRKHKTDREKMNKKPPQEQEKFQPSYDCTVFTDCTMDTFNVYSASGTGLASTPTPSVDSEVADQLPIMGSKNMTIASKSGPFGKTGGSNGGGMLATNASVSNVSSPLSDKNSNSKPCAFNIFADINENSFELNFTNFTQMHSLAHTLATTTHLTSASSAEMTVKWLKENRFDAHLDTFSQFSGKDILVLSKDDLIRICGLTDGIRLYNGLHARNVKPKLTIYLSLPDDEVFRAFYLDTLTVAELQAKIISTLLLSKCNYLKRLCVMGPAGVKVLVSDDVVKNLTEESLYIVELTKDFNGEFSAILKPYTAK